MHYFAYGSNMSLARLQARVPSATPIARATLSGHLLRFHKHSLVDQSAKCDAYFTGLQEDMLWGVLFEIQASERTYLDKAEGLHAGYEIKTVEVKPQGHEEVTAFTYYATQINPSLKPYDWYLHHVVTGAIEADLPAEYIHTLNRVATQKDSNITRAAQERAIYTKAIRIDDILR